jgi:hypothetical protein
MNRTARTTLLVCLAVLLAASLLTTSSAQRRKGDFSHNTPKHKQAACASCHKIPTANWQTARKFPDVADFPGHASCFNCHSLRSVLVGNRPAFCAGCHVTPGPRGVARFPFPVRSRPQEFNTIFPHDVHQNLIARVIKNDAYAAGHFVNASFRADELPEFNNCAICHKTPAAAPRTEPRVPAAMQPLAAAAAETFTAKPEFFKGNPDSHAACFSCHYQGVTPTRTDCAGCHGLTAAYTDSPLTKRYSLKFNHADKNHANKDCTVCHVRITQNSDVRKMKDADVPFQTCSTSSCHGKDLVEEIGKREASIAAKQPAFQCTYCHAPAVGRYPIPASHTTR